ncbi:MAG TPA: MauE/DoxX family redox-associated membrane protein [Ktedonobacteraceae bacterium]|jgi:peroxiredoxin|nr:MauE/DoxX family redox-associated membrane protein [Ktedonobacteraceae bacterium]
MSLISFALELYFAAMLGVSGLTKIDDLSNFEEILSRQHIIPSWSIKSVARILPWLEIVIAFFLVTGFAKVINAIIVVILFGSFLSTKIILLITGRAKDCGCYGNAKIEEISGSSIVVSVILILCTLIHLGLIIWVPSVNWMWRSIGITLFIVGEGFLAIKMLVKSKEKFSPTSTHYTELGGIEVGEMAPGFTTRDQNGKSVGLNDFKAKWLLLLFISPGCPACPHALKALNRVLQEEPELAGLVVASPNLDVNRKYVTEHQIDIPVLTSIPGPLEDIYHVHVFPFLFVLDDKNVVRAKGAVSNYDLLRELLSTIPSVVSS